MTQKNIKKFYVDLNGEGGSLLTKFLPGQSKAEFEKDDIELLRKIFSNEKARIIYFLRRKKPSSIYALAKLLKRDFKSVYQDLKVLERFKIIEFHAEKKGDRESLRPVLKVEEIQLLIRV